MKPGNPADNPHRVPIPAIQPHAVVSNDERRNLLSGPLLVVEGVFCCRPRSLMLLHHQMQEEMI